MGDSKKIESLVEQAVGEVLNNVVPGLRQLIVSKVLETLRPEIEASSSGAADSQAMNEAMAAVQAGTTQVQILDAMIDGTSRFAARTSLYVVRGANAVGWRARGFKDDDAVRNNSIALTEGLPAQAIDHHLPVAGPTAEFSHGFAERFGAPQQDALVCPLVVRDKVVAVVYADGGTNEHRMDRAAIEALVRTASLWLEVFATRKATPAHEADHTVEAPSAKAAAASAVATPMPVLADSRMPVAVAETATALAEAAPVVAPASAPVAAPAEEDEVHKKARRFAKLLVDEIKLYNQAKVNEGKKNSDLYDRLKEDIEKSRASYEKRYGSTAASDKDYFNQELVRILADNDAALLGGNFQR
jgi:hypothetical protein